MRADKEEGKIFVDQRREKSRILLSRQILKPYIFRVETTSAKLPPSISNFLFRKHPNSITLFQL